MLIKKLSSHISFLLYLLILCSTPSSLFALDLPTLAPQCTLKLVSITKKLKLDGFNISPNLQKYMIREKISGEFLSKLVDKRMVHEVYFKWQDSGDLKNYEFFSTLDLGKNTYQIFYTKNIVTGEKNLTGLYQSSDLRKMYLYYNRGARSQGLEERSFKLKSPFETAVFPNVKFERVVVPRFVIFKLQEKHEVDLELAEKLMNALSIKKTIMERFSPMQERAKFYSSPTLDGFKYRLVFKAFAKSKELHLVSIYLLD